MRRLLLALWLLAVAAGAKPYAVTFHVDPPEAGVYYSDGNYLGAVGAPLTVELPPAASVDLEIYCPDYERYPVHLTETLARGGRFPQGQSVQALTPISEGVRWKRILSRPSFWIAIGVVGLVIGFPAAAKVKKVLKEARRGRRLAALEADMDGRMTGDLSSKPLGAYQLFEIVGRGGFGVVYKAYPSENLEAEPVAVKVMQQGLPPDDLERFKREIVVCRKLNHPGIVQLLDYGDQDGAPYYVMDFVEGETLTKRMHPEGIEPDLAWRGYLKPLLEAMAYAHGHGVVHRDLKPDNIMMTVNGRLKIMDFGLATAVDAERLTATGQALGTPAFMPPEQINGAEVDARADQYAIGVIAYEMVTGTRPFTGSHVMEVLTRQLTEDPQPPSEIRPMPLAFEAVILRMLSKEPHQRFPSLYAAAQEMEAALRQEAPRG